MPYKPKRPCKYPGCPALCDGPYCEAHSKLVESQYNKYGRTEESKKWYGRPWKRIRRQYLWLHPLCKHCGDAGKMVPATQVHHIIPLAGGGTNSFDNLMGLCHSCHSTVTAREGGRWKRRG